MGGSINSVEPASKEYWSTAMRKRTRRALKKMEIKSINAVTSVAEERLNGEWEKITATADSGAADTVGPKSVGKSIPIRPTKASMAGIGYVAANGTKINNYGERRLQGVNHDWTPMGMSIQVSDVNKVLAAVSQICDAGNRVVFDNVGSYIESKATGKRTAMRRENGVYKFDMWIQKGKFEDNVDNVETDFTRLEDDLM